MEFASFPFTQVLLSFGDLEHIGALPVAYKLGLRAPTYCTQPTLSLGHQTLYEAHECQPTAGSGGGGGGGGEADTAAGAGGEAGSGGFSAFGLDDVDEALAPMDPAAGRRHGVTPPTPHTSATMLQAAALTTMHRQAPETATMQPSSITTFRC